MEPVEIVILPAGKSLDACVELREARKVRTVDCVQRVRRKKRKKKKTGTVSAEVDKKYSDMFEFLNTEVFSGITTNPPGFYSIHDLHSRIS